MKNLYNQHIQSIIDAPLKSNDWYDEGRVYHYLKVWLKKEDLRLSNEMFKAILASAKQLYREYLDEGTTSIPCACSVMSMRFHDFSAKDGIHTDEKKLQEYVKRFFPYLQKELELEKRKKQRKMKKAAQIQNVDIRALEHLFDQIVAECNQNEHVVKLINDFVIEK